MERILKVWDGAELEQYESGVVVVEFWLDSHFEDLGALHERRRVVGSDNGAFGNCCLVEVTRVISPKKFDF
jgi:hypothetical protein